MYLKDKHIVISHNAFEKWHLFTLETHLPLLHFSLSPAKIHLIYQCIFYVYSIHPQHNTHVNCSPLWGKVYNCWKVICERVLTVTLPLERTHDLDNDSHQHDVLLHGRSTPRVDSSHFCVCVRLRWNLLGSTHTFTKLWVSIKNRMWRMFTLSCISNNF